MSRFLAAIVDCESIRSVKRDYKLGDAYTRHYDIVVTGSPFVMVIAYLVFAFFLYCFIPQDSWTVV